MVLLESSNMIYINLVPFRCKKHPRYKAIRRPSGCIHCIRLYQLRQAHLIWQRILEATQDLRTY